MRAGLLSLPAARLARPHCFSSWTSVLEAGACSPLHETLGCCGSPTLPWCWGGPALSAFLKGAPGPKGSQRPFQHVIKAGFAQAASREAGPFHPMSRSDGKQDCSVCYLHCSVCVCVCLGQASLPTSHLEHLPLPFLPPPLLHPAGILPRCTGLPPSPSFNSILLQSGVVLSISPAKHKAALSPFHSSRPGFAFQLTIVPLICADGGICSKCQAEGLGGVSEALEMSPVSSEAPDSILEGGWWQGHAFPLPGGQAFLCRVKSSLGLARRGLSPSLGM